jgi:hypothetical protein
MKDWYLIVSAFALCSGLVTHAMGLHAGKQQNDGLQFVLPSLPAISLYVS